MAINAQSVPVDAGTPPTFAAPLATDTVPVGCVLIVKNASASSVTVTLATPGKLPTGDDYPDKAVSVPASSERWIPVYQLYMNGNGVCDVTFSSVTSVTAAAIIVPPIR